MCAICFPLKKTEYPSSCDGLGPAQVAHPKLVRPSGREEARSPLARRREKRNVSLDRVFGDCSILHSREFLNVPIIPPL